MSIELLHITQDEWEVFEEFLSGNLDAADRAQLELKIAKDPVWQQKLRQVQEMKLGIKEAALQQDLNVFHQKIKPADVLPQPKVGAIGFKKYAIAAGIAGLLFLGGWLLFSQPGKNEKLFVQYYTPDPGLFTAMSASNDKYIFEKGMVFYKSGNYTNALDIWAQLPKDNTTDTLNYFIGSAFLASGKTKESLPYLLLVANDTTSVFYKDACWYAGLAYIKNKETEKAKPLIRQSDNNNKTVLLQSLQN